MAKNKKTKKQKNVVEAAQGAADGTIPAEVAGVRVPASLRNAGAQLREFAKDPIVTELVASGLIAAAAALSQTKGGRRATAKAADTAEDAVDEVSTAGSAAKQMLIGLAREVLDAVESSGKSRKPTS